MPQNRNRKVTGHQCSKSWSPFLITEKVQNKTTKCNLDPTDWQKPKSRWHWFSTSCGHPPHCWSLGLQVYPQRPSVTFEEGDFDNISRNACSHQPSNSTARNLPVIDLRASQVVLMVKNLSANAGDAGSIPGSGGSPGVGNGNLLQCFCLENPMDRRAWWATVHGFVTSQARLTEHTCATKLPLYRAM